MGGATEATVWSNYFKVEQVCEEWNSIPYGYPIQNCRYYVLNEAMDHCAIECEGDLYIAGVCVASGYINDPETTAKKFLPDPWYDKESQQMYSTGDSAKWREEGWLEFRGRKDEQVKINGYRIELGEIRGALGKIKGIMDSVVFTTGEFQNKKINCAIHSYDISDPNDIKRDLSELLPSYMIPQEIKIVRSFPVGPTGKTDIAAIKATFNDAISNTGAKIVGDTERQIQKIWCDILGINTCGDNDNFFSLGGHSLLAGLLVAELREEFQVDIKLSDFFRYPFLDALTKMIVDKKVALYDKL